MAKLTTKQDVFGEVKALFGTVPSWMHELPDSVVPLVWGLLRDFELAETAIPNKYKELIGIAVSGATRCRYCALFHTEAAKMNGATDQEIAEASMMGGATMCISTFLNAHQTDYERFRKETLEIVGYAKQHAKPPEGKAPKARAHA